MSTLREKLDALLRQGARDARVELYHWELSRAGPRARLLVYIDSPTGVTLADCQRASRAIEALLDEHDPLAFPYVLEVSSPGVERRLWEEWHYRRALGKPIRVTSHSPQGKKVACQGRLVGVGEGKITVDCQEGRMEIPLSQVTRAQVVFEARTEGR
ncbi:MAG: Ribosome maturation factor RimP [Acetothermia bacterium 64_32]|nr:MAG: Ribosome maturation factor RimP [Acetothermia bacterium 64_32]HAF70928.1 hypothetical protein [Candidatus Acetothermia bacterium]